VLGKVAGGCGHFGVRPIWQPALFCSWPKAPVGQGDSHGAEMNVAALRQPRTPPSVAVLAGLRQTQWQRSIHLAHRHSWCMCSPASVLRDSCPIRSLCVHACISTELLDAQLAAPAQQNGLLDAQLAAPAQQNGLGLHVHRADRDVNGGLNRAAAAAEPAAA